MLKLYFSPHTCALASHIALQEAGADFEIVRIDFARHRQTSNNSGAAGCGCRTGIQSK
jgi:glutathione S-transferase